MEKDFNMKIDADSFNQNIEQMVLDLGPEMSYIDAIVEFCTKHEIDTEDVVPYINRTILSHIETEAMNLGVIPKVAQLPL
jgi:hypothetical protein